MRGWCGCGARPTVALDAAPAVSAVVAAPACCRVRREHASDALAGDAAALASEGKRAAAHSRSTLAAGGKAAAAGQQRPQSPCRRLPPVGSAERWPAGSARQRCRQGRLPAPSADRRRPGCAPGRAGTETSWGRSCGSQILDWRPRRSTTMTTSTSSSTPTATESASDPVPRFASTRSRLTGGSATCVRMTAHP